MELISVHDIRKILLDNGFHRSQEKGEIAAPVFVKGNYKVVLFYNPEWMMAGGVRYPAADITREVVDRILAEANV